jgi:hypothetical protein
VQLEQAAALALRTGAAALARRRLGAAPAAGPDVSHALDEAYRSQQVYSMVCEHTLSLASKSLAEYGVEAVLVKGWGVARDYPEPALRPYGDLDLLVLPEALDEARRALDSAGLPPEVAIELHTEWNLPFDREPRQVLKSALSASCRGVPVRVPAPEVQLRLLCLHLLNHGAWRPLWLCDVAMLIEKNGSRLNWQEVLAGRPLYSDWVRATVRLAGEVLGADLAPCPPEVRQGKLPSWLVPAVHAAWSRGSGSSLQAPLDLRGALVRGESSLPRLVSSHLRNPIEASVELEAPFDSRPRLPLQVLAALRRLPRVLRRSHAA